MRFRVLGPIHIGPGTPSAAKLRTVLGALLVRANEVVSADCLIQELWGEEPPRTATTTLQVYISKLRTALAEQADADGDPAAVGRDERIVTRSPGYLMRVLPEELDLIRFEALYSEGVAAFRSEGHPAAARLLREALDLWGGPVLAGVPRGPLLEAVAVRLEEMRMNGLEMRIAADLRLGRHRDLVGELTALAREHPLREAIHAHLMTALYRSDRQSDALRVFERLRRVLVEELGTEPGAALRQLHQQLLRFDERLEWREPDPVPAPDVPVVRLPPAGELVGRADELAAAARLLRGADGAPGTRVLAVVGRAGVGKTAFAVGLAHQVADAFPDGRVLVPLRGAQGNPLGAAEVLARLLRRLAPDEPAVPVDTAGVDELAERLHRTVAGRRLLLVLDDAVSEGQVRPVLAAVTGGAVVVTATRMFAAVDGVRHVALDVLAPAAAAELLVTAAGRRACDGSAAVAEIARMCGGLPLALRVAGALLEARPHWTAAALVERLRDERTRLAVLAIGDLDVRAGLMVGYRECAPAERAAFRLLGLTPTNDFPLWSAAALVGTTLAAAEDVVERLVHANLLRTRPGPAGGVRFGYHELLRAMALELVAREEPQVTRQAVVRLCGAYLHLARFADTRLTPGRVRDAGGADPGPDGLDPAAVVGDVPLRWFQDEDQALLAVVRLAHSRGLWDLTCALADSLTGYFQVSAAWDGWEVAAGLALDAARRAGDPAAEARALGSLGDLAWQRRQVTRAAGCFHLARRRARQARDDRAEARSLIGLADVTLDQGLPDGAWRMYARALTLCRADGDLRGLTDALRGLALTELRRGRSDAAVDRFDECHRVARRLGDRRWSEFARRAAERIRLAPAQGRSTAVEVRPGVWSIGGATA